jgi:hypothetical protein
MDNTMGWDAQKTASFNKRYPKKLMKHEEPEWELINSWDSYDSALLYTDSNEYILDGKYYSWRKL